jgi:hypothetical protein
LSEFVFQLWHGTSAHLLDEIEKHGLGGKNLVRDWRVLEFLQLTFPLCEFDQNNFNDPDYGELLCISSAALQKNEHMNFQHGQLYATGGFDKAASYAQRAPEILDFVKILLRVGESRNIPKIKNILTNFPEISEFVLKEQKPVVLKLPKIDSNLIRNEKGGEYLFFDKVSDDIKVRIHEQSAYRINCVIPFSEIEIINVY